MTDTITTDLSPVPSRSAPSTFSSRMNTWLGKISTWTDEANALAVGANANKLAAETAQGEAEQAVMDAEAQVSLASGHADAAESARDIAVATANATIYAAGTTYGAGDVVLDPGGNYAAYISQQAANTGNTPNTDDGTWWEPLLKSMPDGDIVGTTDTQTLTNKTLEGGIITQAKYEQAADASLGTGTHTFSYAAGDMQQLTATGDITIAFSNFPAGKPASYVIDAVNWGAHTITHPAALLFAAGTAPTYTSSGTDRLLVIKDKDDVYSLFIIGQEIGAVA